MLTRARAGARWTDVVARRFIAVRTYYIWPGNGIQFFISSRVAITGSLAANRPEVTTHKGLSPPNKLAPRRVYSPFAHIVSFSAHYGLV
jgi:hypothetical protein